MGNRLRRLRIGTFFVFVLLSVVLVALLCYIAFSSEQHSEQAESQLLSQAQAFTEEMDAVWQFFDVNQDTINYDSDGNYDFKGLYCSIVGKGVGAIFSAGSDYTVRYTNVEVRNKFDRPDDFESAALALFRDGSGETEYYAMTTYEDKPVFRYVSAIPLKQSCLQCHGEPKGEIDVTGYPKEGLQEGDLAGAISIIIPATSYIEDQEQTLIVTICFFAILIVLIAVTLFAVIRTVITKPLAKLAVAATDMSDGKLDVSLDSTRAQGELGDLVDRFTTMARQLEEAYAGLEEKVADKTEEIRQANEILERQRKQLEVSNDLLQQANKQLVIDNRYKDDFLAVMSHELRTPLTAILTFVSVLEHSGMESAKERNALKELKSNTVALLNMINDTLEMAAIQAGHGNLIVEEVDLVDIVNFVESSVSSMANLKRIALRSVVDRNVPIIRGDWERLRHALENLLTNAIKFTGEGGSVDIGVSVDEGSDAVIVRVRDTGIGIQSEDLGRVFDKFTQIENSTTRGYNGSGLGLCVVKEIVELHGGSVFVESEPGVGSEFGFSLPTTAGQPGEGERR